MNWTGGGLSRSRNANSSISAKQKTHFAKVRAKMYSAQSSTPRRHSVVLDHWQPEYEIVSSSQSLPNQQQTRSQPQTILDGFEGFRPLIKKLESLNKAENSNKRKYQPLECRGGVRETKTSKSRALSPIILSSKPSSVSSAQTSFKIMAPEPNQSRWDDPLDPTRNSLEAKRRRLLQMDDWVGVEGRCSKPVHMKFTEAEDRDMIGKRRQVKITHITLPYNDVRPSERKAYVGDSRRITSPCRDCGLGPMSIRIGSAVDRSQASVRSEEMLFNAEEQGPEHRPLPAAPVMQAGELGSVLLSDHDYRNVHTSSTILDDSSSQVLKPPRSQSRPTTYQTARSPVEISDEVEVNTGTVTLDPTQRPIKLAPPQDEQPFRLVFENTPHPVASDSEQRDCNPSARDSSSPKICPPPVLPTMLPPSRQHNETDSGSDSSPETLARGLHPRANETAQPPTVPQGYASSSGSRGGTATSKLENNDSAPRNHSTSQDALRTLREDNSPLAARVRSTDQNVLSFRCEGESLWRNFTAMDELEETKSLQVRPTSANTAKQPITNAKPNVNEPPKPTAEEEEQIWRAFIFSNDDDDDPNHQWTLESCTPSTHSPSLSNTDRIQPSMIAEVATSPIKQNPHLHEARLNFTDSHDSAKTRSSDVLAEVSPHTEIPSDPSAERPTTSEPSMEVSPTARRTSDSTFTPWQSEKPSGTAQFQHPPSSSLIAEPPTTVSSSLSHPYHALPPPSSSHPKSLPPPASSLIARPPSTMLSSDELHGSPPQPPLKTKPISKPTIKANEPEIIFHPPKRYIGAQATEPCVPLALGRVLRNGKRVVAGTGGEMRRKAKGTRKQRGNAGRGRGAVRKEGEDEIVDY